jgi:signal transduction histidine kinase
MATLSQISPPEANAKILYIDDDPINRRLVNRLLSNYNFRVIEAGTGMEGIKIARKETPDLILMDINMPGLDGRETTTRMRTIAGLQETPIVAITANTTAGDRELAIAAGCDGYINKPIDVDTFPHQVMTYLEGRKDTITQDEQQHYLGKYSQRLVERLEAKIIELEDANARLQKIDKLKSDFITIAAHELRTPITLVYGYSRLLQSAVKEAGQGNTVDEGVVDLAGRIYNSVYRLSEVVNDILNIALIEANQMRLEHTVVNLETVIKAALQELNPGKNNRILSISLEGLENLPPIMGDTERLQQAFWNILSNAIKFTPDYGSIQVKSWLADSAETSLSSGIRTEMFAPVSQDQSLIIMIKDTGIGINPLEQKEIFNRFYMIQDPAYHTSSKTAFGGGGMGLGLSITKGIIEAHGGRIWVESSGRNLKEYPGSTFYVLLPVHIS